MPIATVTAAQLKKWRGDQRLTQKRAADKLQVELRTYQNWEQGHRKPQNSGPIRKLMDQMTARRGKRADPAQLSLEEIE